MFPITSPLTLRHVGGTEYVEIREGNNRYAASKYGAVIYEPDTRGYHVFSVDDALYMNIIIGVLRYGYPFLVGLDRHCLTNVPEILYNPIEADSNTVLTRLYYFEKYRQAEQHKRLRLTVGFGLILLGLLLYFI